MAIYIDVRYAILRPRLAQSNDSWAIAVDDSEPVQRRHTTTSDEDVRKSFVVN